MRGDDVVIRDRPRRIACVQLDVENHEYRALRGLQGVIEQHWPPLLLETIDDDTLAWLRARSYSCARRVHQNTAWLRGLNGDRCPGARLGNTTLAPRRNRTAGIRARAMNESLAEVKAMRRAADQARQRARAKLKKSKPKKKKKKPDELRSR